VEIKSKNPALIVTATIAADITGNTTEKFLKTFRKSAETDMRSERKIIAVPAAEYLLEKKPGKFYAQNALINSINITQEKPGLKNF